MSNCDPADSEIPPDARVPNSRLNTISLTLAKKTDNKENRTGLVDKVVVVRIKRFPRSATDFCTYVRTLMDFWENAVSPPLTLKSETLHFLSFSYPRKSCGGQEQGRQKNNKAIRREEGVFISENQKISFQEDLKERELKKMPNKEFEIRSRAGQ